ncbi:DUF6036 family nucleotidyltransferase [Armatimonas sp.]|uniref:DUF6036 family nucleotidyltransferase n=1 Tax=Armatimonas sp. TaxID=1872638 RepID=UPI00286D1326|nr:DUF6036 family nucleotidyltransferase [Armatimonas sp.]
MPELPAEFRRILALLTEAKIDFVVVGGLAMVLLGTDTVTGDVDISFALDEPNREKLATAVRHLNPRLLGFNPTAGFELTAARLARVRFLNLTTDLGQIDLLPLPSGLDSYEGLKARSMELDMDEFTVRVASIDDLIAMKRAAGRVKDQAHLLELQALKRLLAEGLESDD